MNKYAIRTCAGCSVQKPANELNQTRVKRSGNFSSRKSVTPLTFIGFFIFENKKAKGALESWIFNTSNRKGRVSSTKLVYLCDDCSRNQGGASSFLFKILSFPFRVIFLFLLWVYIKIPIFIGKSLFRLVKIISPYFIHFSKKIGLSAFSQAKKQMNKSAENRTFAKTNKKINAMTNAEILKEAFEGADFFKVAEFSLSLEIAKADEEVSDDEKIFINRKIGISKESEFIALKIQENPKLYGAYKALLKDFFKNDQPSLRVLLINLFAVAEVDGKVSYDELEAIRKISKELGMSEDVFKKIEDEEHKRITDNGNRFVTEDIEKKINDLLSD